MKVSAFAVSRSILLSAIFINIKCSSAAKPNVLVIIGDDVGTGDIPGYWNDAGIVDMPNMEAFMSSGTTYTDAHGTPLCASSRYVFLSGNYQHRGKAFPARWNLNYNSNQFTPGQQSIAQVFKDHGYDTAIFGKWHIGGKIPIVDGYSPKSIYAKKTTILRDVRHDWTQPLGGGPSDIGFDSSYISTGGIQNPPYAFYRNSKLEADLDSITFWKAGNYSMPSGISRIKAKGEGEINWDNSAYNMILVKETEKFLDDHLAKSSNNPFFTYVALGAVHIPHSPPDYYLDGTPIAGKYQTDHLSMLSEVDKVMGSLMHALKERNLLEDTIIVFTSDNGGLGPKHNHSWKYGHFSNGPLNGSKGQVLEGGNRIPMTLRWDNGSIPKGEKRSDLVGLNDLFRTLCDLAKIDVPKGQAVDSVSFADNIYNQNATTRESLGVWSYWPDRIEDEALRKNEMKLIRRFGTDRVALYNLTADISESNDIANVNRFLVKEMIEELEAISPCYDKAKKFVILRKPNKVIRKNCRWFRKEKNRCFKYKAGLENCRFTCVTQVNRRFCHR